MSQRLGHMSILTWSTGLGICFGWCSNAPCRSANKDWDMRVHHRARAPVMGESASGRFPHAADPDLGLLNGPALGSRVRMPWQSAAGLGHEESNSQSHRAIRLLGVTSTALCRSPCQHVRYPARGLLSLAAPGPLVSRPLQSTARLGGQDPSRQSRNMGGLREVTSKAPHQPRSEPLNSAERCQSCEPRPAARPPAGSPRPTGLAGIASKEACASISFRRRASGFCATCVCFN
mmetsp:Transcript_28731/g.72155  ORF Transcript_28731/g.72155 Transcript_28731/m.72155 type:complete len:233 (+) Transcript_28731:171-869(+)